MSESNNERISYIDLLKFVGITGIFIAHVNPPYCLQYLRQFDVILMIFISSMVCRLSLNKYVENGGTVLKYVIYRCKKLTISTWIFLVLYFGLMALIKGQFYDVKTYILSFLFTRYAVGYVWIILIYIYICFLFPLLRKIRMSIKSCIAVITIYFAYEIMYYLGIGRDIAVVDSTLYYIIPYGLIAFLGYNYSEMSDKVKKIILTSAWIIFAYIFIYYAVKTGGIRNLEINKYPPRIYYISYGLGCSFLLLFICEKTKVGNVKSALVDFVSKNSLWLYLWHIITLDFIIPLFSVKLSWYISLLIVFICSLICVYLQNYIMKK